MWFDLCLLLSQTGKRNFQAQKLKKKMEDNQDFSNPNQFSAILSSTRVAKPTHSARTGSPQACGFGTQKNQKQPPADTVQAEHLNLCNSQMLSSSSTSPGSPSCPAGGSVYLRFQGWQENTSPTFKAEASWPTEEGLKDVIWIKFYREEKELMSCRETAITFPQFGSCQLTEGPESVSEWLRGAQGWLPAPGAME